MPKETTPAQREQMLSRVVGALEDGEDQALQQALLALARQADKSLPVVGDSRSKVLAVLEELNGLQFHNDMWAAIAWADKNGFGLHALPRYPIVNDQTDPTATRRFEFGR